MTAKEQLLRALNALYHDSNPTVKDEANRWLEQWQLSQEAWSTADQLLHDSSSAFETQYFCAQTLRTKVQRDFEDLPLEAILGLRESLIQLLIALCKAAPPVRTQLCLTLAALAVQLPESQWGDNGVLRWLAGKLNAAPPDVALPCMLELLTVLPQESNSGKISVHPERRRQFCLELQAHAMDAMDVLRSCMAQPRERMREQVLEAFGSWLRLTQGQGLGGDMLMAHPLVEAALQGLNSGDIFHATVDAVCELIWVTVDSSCNPNPDFQPLIHRIVPAVMALRPRFIVAAQRLHEAH